MGARALRARVAVVRDQAVELLENVLDPEHRRMLLPLIERPAEALSRCPPSLAPVRLPRGQCLRSLLLGEDEGVIVGALHQVGVERLPGHLEEVRALAARGSRLVRGAARWTLTHLGESISEEGSMIDTMERLLYLRGVSLFAPLPLEELAQIAEIASVVRFRADEAIIRQGELGDSLYLIISGEVRVLVGAQEVRRMGAGQSFGEMAILDSKPRSATVIVVHEVLALQIARDDFYDLLTDRIELLRGVMGVLLDRLRSQPTSS